MSAIKRLLIANRGEVAVRILHACRTLGISPVAVYSEADANAKHVRLADEAVLLGPAPARESYLRADRILDAAKSTGCDAVHPGFGFLSENAGFAKAVIDAGLVWVGPPPSAIEAMGLKVPARARMKKAGVPVVPGSQSIADADSVGYPLVVKASAGGGGKGMRVVHERGELDAAVASCRSEAGSSFGDDTVYLERYLERPRHIEVQVLADVQGRTVAVGERECSLQRRHQKVIEESPSPAVDAALRERLSSAAVAAAKAVGYVNAGTVEFLLAPNGEFFFLEMNTRLQVEHPVTEEAFAVDLVALQLRIAEGEPLPEDLPAVPSAHAIEARIYAEDPDAGFLPQIGRALVWEEPHGPGLRVDSGMEEGDEVSIHYDPMLAKVIARGRDREEARRRLVAALSEMAILGVTTNVSYLKRVLSMPQVARGEMDTGFLEREAIPAPPPPDDEIFAAAALAFARGDGGTAPGRGTAASFPDPFTATPFRVLA
jgi:acetyl/propionyl-CoA carboxylase alpha subunit